MHASSLRLQGITRRYAGAAADAVHDLTLDLRAGELLALVGASGSGKTTTLRVAAGYDLPQAGRVLLDDRDITRLAPEHRGFGVVFQQHALFPHLSVEDNVAFGLEARGVARAARRARAREGLASVGLAGTGARAVRELSGGEQQRVALARALVIDPRVLLLDEPLSSLDPTLRIAMRDDLRALLQRRQVTALLVTHDQEDAFAVADRVALLHAGRLLQIGTPEALYDRPASAEVAAFIGRSTLVAPRWCAPRWARATLDGEGARCRATIAIGGVVQQADAAGPDGVSLPRDVHAVLRPEQLALVDGAAAGVWQGIVLARRFTGASLDCRVALDDGGAGAVMLHVRTDARGVREGDRVGVRLVAPRVAVVAAPAARG